MILQLCFSVIIGLFFLIPRPIYAQEAESVDPFDLPRVVAIENKKFNPMKDITFQMGIMPLDAFYKALTIGTSYTHRLNSYMAWEVINANISSPQDTNLKKDLIENFSAKQKGILDSVKYYATTQVVYTPIYSKNLFFNRDVLYGEWSFVGGAGFVGFESQETAPLIGVGLIGRFFSTDSTSYKVDGRLYHHTAPNKSSDLLLMINLGLSFEIGGRTQTKRSL
jgi:outer membrane beta-barrel protein